MSEYTNPNQNPQTDYSANRPYYAERPKKNNGCLIATLIGVGLLVVFIIGFFALIAFAISSSGRDDSPTYSGSNGYVAVIHIEGTIISQSETGFLSSGEAYDHQYLMDSVATITGDPNNSGLLLYIDSPGGEVYATDELYLRIMEYKERTGRPVYAYCASMAASGGYYLAAAADRILMNRNCLTGSIGVTAGTIIDVSEFLEKNGIKTTSIYVGKNKTMGSYFEEFTGEQKQIYISVLREAYDQFVGIVAESREMSIVEVEYLADGRIYSPKQALDQGLIDGIMGYEEALETMISDANLSQNVQFIDFEPIQEIGFGDLFLLLPGNRKTDLEVYLSYAGHSIEGFAYYYEGIG